MKFQYNVGLHIEIKVTGKDVALNPQIGKIWPCDNAYCARESFVGNMGILMVNKTDARDGGFCRLTSPTIYMWNHPRWTAKDFRSRYQRPTLWAWDISWLDFNERHMFVCLLGGVCLAGEDIKHTNCLQVSTGINMFNVLSNVCIHHCARSSERLVYCCTTVRDAKSFSRQWNN
jgi:hypothetical protein